MREPIPCVQLAKRIERWQRQLAELGIAHFRFELTVVDDIECDHGKPVARVCTPSDYDHAHFTFARHFLWDVVNEDTERAWERLDEVIVHEWLHVAMRDLDESITHAEGWMPDATYEGFQSHVSHDEEKLIENLARLIVRLHAGRTKARFAP